MRNMDKMIKDSTLYTISTVLTQLLGIITSIAMRKFLTPEMMGIWTTFLVILNYALFAHLGVFTAVEVKIPYLRGKNENGEIQNIRNIAFTMAVALSLVTILTALAASFILAPRMNADIILGIRMLALIVTATLFYNLYIVMLRADKGFALLSKAIVFNSLAMLVCVSALTYFFKLRGIYFATFFGTLASWFYLHVKTRYSLKFYFNIKLMKMLAKVGLPLILGGVVYTILLSIDKIMIIRMIGPVELGYYSIAVLAMSYAHSFPRLFSIVMFPTMQEEFGKTDSREQIVLDYVKQPTLIMAYLLPVLLAAAYFAMPVLVYYILPKYISGISSMKMLLFGCFFISLVPLTHNFVIAINKQIALIPITAGAVLCGIGMNYIMIKMNYGITGVAFGTSVAYFIYFIAMFAYIAIHSGKRNSILSSLLGMCAPFLYALVVIISLEYFIKIEPMIAKYAVQALIFYLAYTPLLWHINKKTEVISNFFKKKIKSLPEEEMVFPAIPTEEQI